MRVFFTERSGDPMLLDRVAGLDRLCSELRAFAAADSLHGVFPAQTEGDPTPYAEFLRGLRIQRLQGDSPTLGVSADRWLELRAADADLQALCRKFDGVEDGEHRHFYASPISLIIEADESWPGFHEG